MMISKEQFAENRVRILESASRLFRENGFDGVGIADIMKGANMTHGGFYSHFKSKDELAAAACAQALGTEENYLFYPEESEGGNALADILDDFLSDRHLTNVSGGCALAALGSDGVRQPPKVRRAFSDGIQRRVTLLANRLEGSDQTENRQQAISIIAGLIGSLIMARLSDDPELANEILSAGKSHSRKCATSSR